ncbi:MAG: serine/threonine-protein phosphatase [Lachnospiraceae bacterium]|nr:serine/threonine-protein phosphatase [Lachnospiraceae bacterium]
MVDESRVVTLNLEETDSGSGLRYTAYSVPGARESQQDALFVGEGSGAVLAVVCDGMGGMTGGEKASALAVRMLAETFFQREPSDVPGFYRGIVGDIDEAVYGLEDNGKRLGAGTTIVAVTVRPEGLYWLSVGDSRIYLLRRGQMLCPVLAHNYRLLLDGMLAEGAIDEAKYRQELPKAEALISFLGVGGVERMEVNPNPFRLEEGDRILLCSDGLYKSLPDGRIQEILEGRMQLGAKVRQLVEEAVQAGGRRQDNTSVILLQA